MIQTTVLHYIRRAVQHGNLFVTETIVRVVSNPPPIVSRWRKPTVDDGTVSTLDKIRRSPALVIA